MLPDDANQIYCFLFFSHYATPLNANFLHLWVQFLPIRKDESCIYSSSVSTISPFSIVYHVSSLIFSPSMRTIFALFKDHSFCPEQPLSFSSQSASTIYAPTTPFALLLYPQATATLSGFPAIALPQYPVAEDALHLPVAEEAPRYPVAEEAPQSPVAEEAPRYPVAEEAP